MSGLHLLGQVPRQPDMHRIFPKIVCEFFACGWRYQFISPIIANYLLLTKQIRTKEKTKQNKQIEERKKIQTTQIYHKVWATTYIHTYIIQIA